jgi:putative DNA primase/helicase
MGIALKHLSEAERKAIAGELFKVTSTEDHKGELHGLCPIHDEKNPSFSYNFKKDVYHCLSCGADGDLLKLWSEVNGHGQKDGFKAFCTKFGIDLGKDRNRGEARGAKGRGGGEEIELSYGQVMEQMLCAWELFPRLPEDWLTRLEKLRGWSQEMIFILDLRLQTHYLNKQGNLAPIKKPERVAIPIKDFLGRLINVRLYRPGGGTMKILSWA